MAKEEKKIKKRIIPADSTQVNFNLKTELLEKIVVVASKKQCPKSDIYNEAVGDYINSYEAKNGKIKPSKNPAKAKSSKKP